MVTISDTTVNNQHLIEIISFMNLKKARELIFLRNREWNVKFLEIIQHIDS